GDRAEYCIARVEEAMGFAAGRYFVNETFPGESRAKGTKVITDIVKAFKHSLEHLEWMDEESAAAAAEKVSSDPLAYIHDEVLRWAKLGRMRDPEEWEMYPSMVNAYFNPPANEIVFPAGILQPPFFSTVWPNYLSYGSFGQVAAHELTVSICISRECRG
ncbi:zincin, partial [Obba rivulosa]